MHRPRLAPLDLRRGLRSFVSSAALFVAALLSSTACEYGHRVTFRFLEGPKDAIALAYVAPDRLLVLAGTERRGKSVSIFYDSVHSVEILRFPVSRYATGIRGEIDGKFLLSIARRGVAQGERAGAIEEWNVRGQLLDSIEFPGPVVAITGSRAGIVYALTPVAGGFAIVGTRMADGAAVSRTQLRENVATIDQCVLGRATYVLTSSPGTNVVRLIDVKLGSSIATPLVAERPRCSIDGSSIVGLHATSFGSEVSVLHLSTTRQRVERMVGAPDAVDLEPSGDRLFLLRRSGDRSRIDIWLRSDLAEAGL